MAPLSSYLPVLLGIGVATIVSFAISVVILKADAREESESFEQSVQEMKQAKQTAKGLTIRPEAFSSTKKIIFACDAGMGSSAMGASILRKMVQKAGLPQAVTNQAISQLVDEEGTLIITQVELQERAKQKAPHAQFVAVENFLNSPRYDEVIQQLSQKETTETRELMDEPSIEIGPQDMSKIQKNRDCPRPTSRIGNDGNQCLKGSASKK